LRKISKSDAIDCALAHGSIDAQLGGVDECFFKTRFTPRRPKCAWSQMNRTRVGKLAEAGRMTERGMGEAMRAKADGRWSAVYAPQAEAEPDDGLRAALARYRGAEAFFDTLDSANPYALLYRVHQTRTRERRVAKIAEIVEMLSRGETFPSSRYPSSTAGRLTARLMVEQPCAPVGLNSFASRWPTMC
jgi:uncharacterized protein YdeI (YjbR/CyaY-like superfamily)